MKTTNFRTTTLLSALLSLTAFACQSEQVSPDAEFEPIVLDAAEQQELFANGSSEQVPASALVCDPDDSASVGGLYYPGWTCAAAIAHAESSLNSWHYRNACSQQAGTDINDPIDAAAVSSCIVDDHNNAVVSVDLCCEAPALTCDLDEQASVGGLHYPGWTCDDAIADAESNLNSWHYRNACSQQVGSDISSPVDAAAVSSCTIDGNDNAVVSVDVCCEVPSLACDMDEQTSVGGLYYPGWSCEDATADAESNLNSWHYRNACHQQLGSDINSPAGGALVSSCTIDDYDNAVVSVDLCCDVPSLPCDPDTQASVGGIHYPNTSCAAATADAEVSLNSWHYRNACHQQYGSDISTPVGGALVSGCYVDKVGNAVISADVCCDVP